MNLAIGECCWVNTQGENRHVTSLITDPSLLLPGGCFPFGLGRIEHGFDVRPDLCATNNDQSPRKYLGQIYTDSLVHDPKALSYLVDVIGKVRTATMYIWDQ